MLLICYTNSFKHYYFVEILDIDSGEDFWESLRLQGDKTNQS